MIKLLRLFGVIAVVLSFVTCLIDPLSISIGGGIAALSALGYNYKTLKEHTYCKLAECCISDYIPADIEALKNDLEENLYGQHIVKIKIIPALQMHYNPEKSSLKPLVMSFHGTPGTGKNYVSDMIAKNFYKKGVQSKYVHRFMGRTDFPLESEIDTYRTRLQDSINGGVKSCARSLFVFDEVDKMPIGIFDTIVSLLDQKSDVKGEDFRDAVFIFLTNAGGIQIANRLSSLMASGKFREETELHNFEEILEEGAYNIEDNFFSQMYAKLSSYLSAGGLKRTQMIDSKVIDHFIPFLPLEKSHVLKCIEKEFKRLNYTPTDEQIQRVAEKSVTYVDSFSTAGCKRLTKKVEIEAAPGF